MPVRHASQQTDEVGRFNRLSASQANTYRSCPRLWFYEKVYRFKMPQIPVLFVGRAVEEALCRVLKESPNLLVAASGIEVFGESPYSEDGLPVEDVVWPASMLMPLFPEERPDSKEAIEAWAMRRCEAHLPPALENAREAWSKDERRSGDWSEVDPQHCLAMVKNGMRFHLAEVERCFKAGVGPRLRHGERFYAHHGQHRMAIRLQTLRAPIPALLTATSPGLKRGKLHGRGLWILLLPNLP